MLIAVVSCDGARGSGDLTLERALDADWGDLAYEVVGSMPDDRQGGTLIVFLHGYGGSGAGLSRFARAIASDDTRVVLPTAVLPHSTGRGAIWWEFLEEDWPKPYPVDPAAEVWPTPSKQLPLARAAVVELIARVRDHYRPASLVVAGHSQGAMLALDVAASLEPPADRVIALSGYVLLDSTPALTAPREDRPAVLIAHGRQDRIVAFVAGEEMMKLLEANGFAVTFRPHDGGHGIDASVTRDVREFLGGRSSATAR